MPHDGPLIWVVDLSYTYGVGTMTPIAALHHIDLEVARGEYLAIIGHNGSGKSTLARCLNGILQPTQGQVWVDGQSTRRAEALYQIRGTVGLVLQNPDNQFVSTVVEEEIAFGPENQGLPREELRRRVEAALQETGLTTVRQRDPRHLSAGQKARLAIAGILAMRPACLVLDESTAMLDPLARQELLALLRRLHGEGLAIVAITHFMDEVVQADRVIVLEEGRIALQGAPREVFAQWEALEQLGLSLPPAAAIARGLAQRGLLAADQVLTPADLVRAIVAEVGLPA